MCFYNIARAQLVVVSFVESHSLRTMCMNVPFIVVWLFYCCCCFLSLSLSLSLAQQMAHTTCNNTEHNLKRQAIIIIITATTTITTIMIIIIIIINFSSLPRHYKCVKCETWCENNSLQIHSTARLISLIVH